MSTKTTKRKRASAPKTEAAPAASSAALSSDAATLEAAPAVASELATSPPVAASSTGPTLGLASNCTVKDAAALKNEMLQLLDEPASVAIDAKSVERIDTAIMQLLCAFVRDRSQRNAGVTWLAAPQPLLDAARLLGVGTLLSLPQEATP